MSDKRAMVEDLLRGVCKPEFLTALADSGYYGAPAGMYHHGAYEGGLVDHSINVYRRLQTLTNELDLKWQREESPAVIGLLHDVCKIWQYDVTYEEVGVFADAEHKEKEIIEKPKYSWMKHQDLPGHGEASLMRIMMMGGVNLTQEEIYCIRYHMGAYEGKDAWDAMDKAIRRHPNIIYTCTADMLASKIDEKEG